MAAQVIKELHGFSGTQVLLMKKHNRLFVRKVGDVERNVERMYALQDRFPLPIIYGYSKNKLDIDINKKPISEYIKAIQLLPPSGEGDPDLRTQMCFYNMEI